MELTCEGILNFQLFSEEKAKVSLLKLVNS